MISIYTESNAMASLEGGIWNWLILNYIKSHGQDFVQHMNVCFIIIIIIINDL